MKRSGCGGWASRATPGRGAGRAVRKRARRRSELRGRRGLVPARGGPMTRPRPGELGAMYANGTGVPQDAAVALRWFRRAVEQGDARAQNGLGLMYEDGRGCVRARRRPLMVPSGRGAGVRPRAEQSRPYVRLRAGGAGGPRASRPVVPSGSRPGQRRRREQPGCHVSTWPRGARGTTRKPSGGTAALQNRGAPLRSTTSAGCTRMVAASSGTAVEAVPVVQEGRR